MDPSRSRILPTSLSLGAKLGPYEILALLGAGVQGEVYRARDTKLEREVVMEGGFWNFDVLKSDPLLRNLQAEPKLTRLVELAREKSKELDA